MRSSGSPPDYEAISVLLIEDDEDVRLVLRNILEEAGYRVADAATPREAQAYLQRDTTPPSVALLDYRFPSGRAGALLRAIADNDALSRHCVVLLPDIRISYFPPDEQRLIAAHCIDVVYKPFDIEDVLTAVTRAAKLLAISMAFRSR
jgi:DNA-binding NtrC family response regulator